MGIYDQTYDNYAGHNSTTQQHSLRYGSGPGKDVRARVYGDRLNPAWGGKSRWVICGFFDLFKKGLRGDSNMDGQDGQDAGE